MNMKYRELKNGDLFTIVREKSGVIYRKKEFYFEDVRNPRLTYRKLYGGTIVEKVGDSND